MGNPRKNPPKFSVKRYERYRCELLAWIEIADFEADKLGSVIALELPTSEEEGDIRGKVFEDLGDAIRGANGATALVAWLDKHYRVDKITRTVNKIRTMMNTRRNKDHEVGMYLSAFDVAYNSLNSDGQTRLPQAFLMFLLLENAGLTENEQQLIMSGVDTMAPGTLYDQARRGLTKIMGSAKKKTDKFELKEDLASDALYAGGNRFQQRPRAGQGGGQGNWRPNFQSYCPKFPLPNNFGATGGGGGGRGPGGGQGGSNSNIKIDVPLNPIGKDGKRNTCDLCGSFTHYKARCQHIPVQYVDMDQDYVDFHVNYIPGDGEEEGDHNSKVEDTITGAMAQLNSQSDQKSFYATLDSFVVLDVLVDMEQVTKFQMADEMGKVILDTGCISNVTGPEWMKAYIASLSDFAKKKVIKEPSTKVFRFGGGTKLPFIGKHQSRYLQRKRNQ